MAIELVNPLSYPADMKTVSVHEAKTKLSELLEKVEAGEEIVIARAVSLWRDSYRLQKSGSGSLDSTRGSGNFRMALTPLSLLARELRVQILLV